MDECKFCFNFLGPFVWCLRIPYPTAIGQITAEAMDTSKSQFLPLITTQQVISELAEFTGSPNKALQQKVRQISQARDEYQTECYAQLVSRGPS